MFLTRVVYLHFPIFLQHCSSFFIDSFSDNFTHVHNTYKVFWPNHLLPSSCCPSLSYLFPINVFLVFMSILFVFLFFKRCFIVCILVFACMCVLLSICRSQKRGSDILELKLQTIVCCHMSAGNRTSVIWTSNTFSWPLSHLSSLSFMTYWVTKAIYVNMRLELLVGASWTQQWIHNWRRWFLSTQNVSVTNSSAISMWVSLIHDWL